MMGHRIRLKGGLEWDRFTGWRRVVRFGRGLSRFIKRTHNKRVRREVKEKLRCPTHPN